MLETMNTQKQNKDLLEKPELRNLRLLFGLNVFLLIVLFIMPQYFGIHIGWDITCTRLANILLIIYSLLQFRVFNLFTKTFISCSITIPLVLYLLVALYTMIFRVDVNALVLVLLEVLTLYMLIFAIRYVIGVKRAIRIIIGCAYFLSIYGFVEFVAGQSLFLKFLKTVPTIVVNSYRSGYYRIMGPCGHALGYGLLLILFVAMACLDYEKNEIYLYKRPVLLVMLIGNTFLTGSRSSQGIVLVEIVIILILSSREKRKKAVFYSVILVLSGVVFTVVTYNTKIGQYIMMQITMLIDQIFNTELSLKYGAEVTRLQDSENYREYLPKIFNLDWLNPLVGRGVKQSFSAEILKEDGTMIYIKSIDNYYVNQYIKYAYPGLIAYVAFIITTAITMIKEIIKHKSAVAKIIFLGFICYFVNLWWVDALQTLKFVYAYVAVFFATLLNNRDIDKKEKKVVETVDL